MPADNLPVPFRIVRLLISFFSHTITEEQKDQLDEWICETDSNMKLFEECLETTLLPVVSDPERDEYDFEITEPLYLN